MRKAMISDDSTLSLDFTTGLLDSRLTFTRSTTGTYINSSGYVTSAAINAPRFDYDPTTLTARGLLIEGSASNIATYSNNFSNAIWTLDTSSATNPAVSTVSQTGPDGASTVTRITFNKTGGLFSRIWQVVNGIASQPYTMSVWMKANTASGGASTQNVGLRIGLDSAGFNCVVTTTWKRFQYTYTLSGTEASAQIMLWDNIIGNDETADVLVYGCQIEAGSGASSYIPTEASTANRAADSCVMTGTNFSSWFAGATEGVFYAEYEAPRSLGTADYFCLGTVYAAGTFIGMNLANSTRYPQALISPGGGFRLSGGISVAASTPMKHAAKWSGANNVLVFANGAVGTAHSATSGTPTLTMFSIGSSSTSGTAATGDYLNACMRSVKFWRVALPDSRIISITT